MKWCSIGTWQGAVVVQETGPFKLKNMKEESDVKAKEEDSFLLFLIYFSSAWVKNEL